MNTRDRIQATGATLVVGFLLAIALAASAQARPATPQDKSAQEAAAVLARSEAMNRHYQLGPYSPAAVARQGEERRSQAIDRYYGLGRDTVSGTSSGIDRTGVGIGVGALLVTIMVAGGLTVLLRRRNVGAVSTPRTV